MQNTDTNIQTERWANLEERLRNCPIRELEAERVKTFYSKVYPGFSEKLRAAKMIHYA